MYNVKLEPCIKMFITVAPNYCLSTRECVIYCGLFIQWDNYSNGKHSWEAFLSYLIGKMSQVTLGEWNKSWQNT